MKYLFFLSIYFLFLTTEASAQCSANAGSDIHLCTGYVVSLNGSGFSSTGSFTSHKWSGGMGTFAPNSNTFNATYALSPAEIAAGTANLILEVKDINGCISTDTVIIFYDKCPPEGIIKGKVFEDLNANGIQDNGENGIGNKMVYVSPMGYNYFSVTDVNGDYQIPVINGTYEVKLYNNPNWMQTFPTSATIVTINSNTSANNNFGAVIPKISDLTIDITTSGRANPGRTFTQYIACTNIGTETLSGSIEFKHDPSITYLNSLPAEFSYNSLTQTLIYNFTNLSAGNQLLISLDFSIPTTTPLGTSLQSSVKVDPAPNDILQDNNYDTSKVIVTGSYDPNDKMVEPQGIGETHFISSTQELEYTIRFQNTGTDLAYKIVIRDTIDSNLDITSFEMINASHDYTINIGKRREVVWTFNDILLPDNKSNEEESHGFIKYKIKQKSNNEEGAEIKNKAAIYFDYNYPIITNETLNTISDNQTATFLNGNVVNRNITIFPNPASSVINVETSDENCYYSIITNKGNVVQEGKISFPINIEKLEPGIYIIKLQTEKEIHYEKILVK